MNWTSTVKGIGIATVSFFIARCQFLDINPLIIGFFMACCLMGKNVVWCFVGGLVGLVTEFLYVDVIKYGLVMIIIAGILNTKQLMETRGRELYICLLSGIILALVGITFRTLGLSDIPLLTLGFEAGLVFASAMVYYYALNVLKSDYGRIAIENEATISCIALGATILLGVPEQIFGVISLVMAVAVFGMITVLYKFGFGVGMCWCMTTGLVVSYITGVTELFLAWIIIGALTQGLACAFGGGRLAFGLFYLGVYFFVGTYLYKGILTEEGVKALASALFVFFLAPKNLMLRLSGYNMGDDSWDSSPEWGRLIIDRVNNLSRAFKRIEYTFAGDSGVGIGFCDVGNIIQGFTNQLERTVPMKKNISAAIVSQLECLDIHVKNIVLLKNQEERYEVYITSKVRRGKLVLASVVRDIVSKETGMDMELKEESRNIVSRNYQLICLRQKPSYSVTTAVRRLSRYENEISGDDIYVGDILDGQKLIMLADGMGNGKEAAGDSGMLIEIIQELLTAGFDKETSIKMVNTYLSDKNKGERFSTLDMLILDMHTGYGRLYKQGASTTFVKRGQWIELIKSTSLPVGVIDGAVCESCKKKFYHDDIIVMISDGVLESIVFENKEDYLKQILLNLQDMEAEEVATALVDEIRNASGNRLKDDASVIVVKIKKK